MTEHDALGRVTREIDGYTTGVATPTSNRITMYRYDGLDHVIQETVYNAVPGQPNSVPQTTTYIYGAGIGGGFGDPDFLGGIVYPDQTSDRYARDALGEIIIDSQRTGSVHQYTYDAEGHELSDLASIAAGMDGTVQKLSYQYNTLGQMTLASSEGGVGGVWGTVNQVMLSYNGFGQLIGDAQEHAGAINDSTPTVQYGYTSAATGSLLFCE